MSPDERSTVPPPHRCRQCMHYAKYITQRVERHLCEVGKPMHEACPWFVIRNLRIGET